MDTIEVENDGHDTNPVPWVFTNKAHALFAGVLEELEQNDMIDRVSVLFEDIRNACLKENNGVCLIALADALSTLVGAMLEVAADSDDDDFAKGVLDTVFPPDSAPENDQEPA